MPTNMPPKAIAGWPARRRKRCSTANWSRCSRRDGKVYDFDDGVRPDSTAESLAKLRPAFERPWGKVTPGNSSQITDGASWVILASEDAIAKHGLTPRAKIVDCAVGRARSLDHGTGAGAEFQLRCSSGRTCRSPTSNCGKSTKPSPRRCSSCVAAFKDEKFCREVLQLDGAAGAIDRDKLNVDGGGIGLGHPVGASGNRIVLHLANALKRLGLKRGIASQCIGGGLGGAMLIEAV